MSNSKDQTLKVWDVRRMSSDCGAHPPPVALPAPGSRVWDYRFEHFNDGNDGHPICVPSSVGESNNLCATDESFSSVKTKLVTPSNNVSSGPCSQSSRGDLSVHTLRGHRVLQTLIWCYLSPQFTTGERYAYSGSQTGGVYVWDLTTGHKVRELCGHHSVVRDVAWHPYDSVIASSSLDGTVALWAHGEGVG
jgi:WD40 repeat protein